MNTNKAGSTSGGAYGPKGVGNTTTVTVDATRSGRFPGDADVRSSQGEGGAVGSIYSAMFNERPNVSNPRNRGPERDPSRDGATQIPIARMSSRNTGRV